MPYRSPWMTDEIVSFSDGLRRFIEVELAPHTARWRAQGMVDRTAWLGLGRIGALCPDIPEIYGGHGGTFAHVAAVCETLEQVLPEMALGVLVHNAVTAQYIVRFGSEEQKLRWLPSMTEGRVIGAIALTEPGAGSDLQNLCTRAALDGASYRITGQKTFITNGQLADLIVLAVKTEAAADLSLVVIEANETPGFSRGRSLDKIGLQASDTAELFFDEAIVPSKNRLGPRDGLGFAQLMEQLPTERLALAIQAVAATERAVDITADYAKNRRAFGKPIFEFQNTAFKLSERRSEACIARVFVDWCIDRLLRGELDHIQAAIAKWWTTAKQVETMHECLQLHGGYGYMRDFEIARRFMDARIQTIYGGTNEVMKMIIAQSL
jgi:acyl-CoA dehydrogenase